MLMPNRFTDAESSIINISALIINDLLEFQILEYQQLLTTIENKIGSSAITNFPYALLLLYSLNKIEYLQDIDSLRLK